MSTFFFSECAEGSSKNKYLEIFNPVQADISLIDLGDDSKRDVVSILSTDLISKRIKLTKFDEKDELVIGDETFSCFDLQSDNPDRIKVGFRGETSAIVPEESSGSNASTGFDFL